jgi:FkbM family methyltransferase
VNSYVARFIVRGLKARFRDEKAELRAIRDHVSLSDTVCDIGANKGNFTFWLAKWCRNGRVIAFEPQSHIASRLAADCTALKFSNVKVEPIGVFSATGSQTLSIPIGHSPCASIKPAGALYDNVSTVSIPVVALDDYFSSKERVSLLKIDVEGAELDVLRGAERILKTFFPLLVFECENRHFENGSVDDVFDYLASIGYQGEFVCRRKVRPISEFDVSVHQRADREWFWKSADYCHNFIFSKDQKLAKVTQTRSEPRL